VALEFDVAELVHRPDLAQHPPPGVGVGEKDRESTRQPPAQHKPRPGHEKQA
jgi:hypothetical protein